MIATMVAYYFILKEMADENSEACKKQTTLEDFTPAPERLNVTE